MDQVWIPRSGGGVPGLRALGHLFTFQAKGLTHAGGGRGPRLLRRLDLRSATLKAWGSASATPP
jgi:hypothetical protein